MKRSFITTGFLVMAFLFRSLSAYATETLTLDPNHTYVLWHIQHFGFSTQVGKWYAAGTLILDNDKLQNSKVNATIPMAKIVTGLPDLDEHLKGKLFFDVVQFPTATFVSDKIEITSKKTAKVAGTLTLHGVAKPVVLVVKLNKIGINPITNNITYGFSGHTTLRRSDFGINTLLPGLGDVVAIDVEAEAFQPSKQ